MKKTFKRIVAALLVAVMLFGSAPIESLTGFDIGELFGINAEAAEENWLWPVPSVQYLTNGRYYWWVSKDNNHNGIDIPGNNLDVVASKSGTVMYVYSGCNLWSHGANSSQKCTDLGICAPKRNGEPNYSYSGGMCNHGFGRGVVINHGDGTYSHYAHMSSVSVSHGQYVKQGEFLGKTGAYGNAYGAHLHFTLARGNMWGVFNNTPSNLGNYPNAAIPYIFSVSTPVTYKNGAYKTNASNIRFRSGPSTSTTILAEMPKGTILEVTDVTDAGWGKVVYNGQSGWVALWHTDYVGETMPKPKAPVLTAEKTGDVPAGTKVELSWNAVDNANGYKIYINGKAVDNGINTSYLLDVSDAKNYSVYVVAHNPKHTSEKSQTVEINGKPDCKVTFKDWDGTVLETKTVKYGENAVLPDTPVREGYTFAGWDKSTNRIVADTEITATYKINKYTITFLGYDNNEISVQNVEYGNNATEPSDPLVPAGYKFFGWDSEKHLNVKEDAVIRGIYDWGNKELPIVAQITSATRQEDGYYVYFDLKNYPEATTRGRAVVSLKTAEGKLVDTTESAAFSIPANGTKNGMEVFIPCEYAASYVEVIIVNSYSSGVPISASVSAEVDQGLEWSDWSDTAPEEGIYTELETRTVYRYRDKEYSTANSKTKQGWTYAGTYSSAVGSWSDWQWDKIEPFENEQKKREVKTQQAIKSYTKKTQYVYTHWHGGWSSIGPYWYNDYSVEHTTGGIDTRLTQTGTTYRPYFRDYTPKYGGWYCTKCGYSTWYNESTIEVNDQPIYATQYKYRDTVYTYDFYRWLEWSEWSTTAVEAADAREVETKTQYRYRNEFGDAGIEDVTGVERTVNYNLDESYAGKQVTLFVYKVDEASDWTNEYIGQSVVGDDGSCNFTYKLREEPSEKTGDLTVALGVEGTSNIFVVDTIEAPKPEYTVVFRDWDGTVIDTQTVEEGGNAACPDFEPSREGYDFAGWSTTVTAVNSDLEIEARYIIKTYTVVFVDWTTREIVTKEFEHGEQLVSPEKTDIEGYNFVGWSGADEGEIFVTKDMIVTAEYDAETYEVNIYDYDMNVIDTQTVEHSEYVELPDEIEKSKYIFLGWKDMNNNDLNSVTDNLSVYPEFIFVDTAIAPVADIKIGVYTENQVVELTSATESAVIYYTTDGTDPLNSNTSKLYSEPIEITRSTELKFAASAFEMNDSDVVTEVYAVNTGESAEDWVPYDELPDAVLENPVDYSLVNDIGYRYKDVVVTAKKSQIDMLEENGWKNEGFEYGVQSDWQIVYPEIDDTLYEVIEQKPPQVEEIRYSYNHFKYYDEATQSYICSPAEVENVEGVWEEYVSPQKLSVIGFVSGTTTPYYIYNGERWFNQTQVSVMVDPDYMMYSYKLKNYTFSKWTDWSVETPAEDETRETESNTVYSYTMPDMCIVTVVSNIEGVFEKAQLGIVGKPINIDTENMSTDGYILEGLYKDAAYTDKWDLENEILTESITLYAKFQKSTYTVTFCDSDGTVLKTQTAEHGAKAEPPSVDVQGDNVFVGWDKDDYLFVDGDMVITAVIKNESEIVKVNISRSKFTTTVGSAFYLSAAVTPEELENKNVTWTSDNYDIADVNDEGVVMAISSGTATITATAFDGTSASCVVTVLGDSDSELTLKMTSSLAVDSSGYLRNIPIITDESMGTHTAETVAEIKRQFINDSIVIVDMNGKTLSDEDSVGTGSVVRLMDGESVIDSITIIVTGDYDGDGEITNRDAARISRFTVDKEEPNLYQNLAMDVNGDGYVNNRDASMVSRYLVGKETL